MMSTPVWVKATDDLHAALDLMLAHGMRELLVVDDAERVIGVLDEAEITAAYVVATSKFNG
jgi:CIC family chloride channel protein